MSNDQLTSDPAAVRDGAGSLRLHRPEAGRFWIEHSPLSWAGASARYTDLARGTLGGAAADLELPEAELFEGRTGVVYLPPCAAAVSSRRERLIQTLSGTGAVVLVQRRLGERALDRDGVSSIFDPLVELLTGRLEAFESLPAGAAVVWPLIAGITDDGELWRRGCDKLADCGARFVQPITLHLDGRERRWLAGEYDRAGIDVFGSVFHRAPAAERSFSQVAHRHGLEPFTPRPLNADGRRRRNRQVAELLLVAAEVWLTLGRSEARGHTLYQSARWADATPIDITALATEGNLEIVAWLQPDAAEIIRDFAATGRSRTVARLLAEYLENGDGGGEL